MAVFISYNEKDVAVFSTLRGGLEAQGVIVWKPESMEAGASLRDQLRDAINKCHVCVFLATKNSIHYDWCLAQVGAFWGAGKRVIVFRADPEIIETQLPPQLHGNVWHNEFDFVVRDVKKIIFDAEDERKREDERRPKMVSEMTIGALYDALTSLRSTALDSFPVSEAIRLIHENISHNLTDPETMQPLIGRLVGVPQRFLEEIIDRYWPTRFMLVTDTGEWIGFARKFTSYELARESSKEYSNCLLVLYKVETKVCAAAVAARDR
jgi:hypothetical protein